MDPALNIFALNENAAHVALIRGNRSNPIASTGVEYTLPAPAREDEQEEQPAAPPRLGLRCTTWAEDALLGPPILDFS